jgi:SNF2 family DNA or RNA helicase
MSKKATSASKHTELEPSIRRRPTTIEDAEVQGSTGRQKKSRREDETPASTPLTRLAGELSLSMDVGTRSQSTIGLTSSSTLPAPVSTQTSTAMLRNYRIAAFPLFYISSMDRIVLQALHSHESLTHEKKDFKSFSESLAKDLKRGVELRSKQEELLVEAQSAAQEKVGRKVELLVRRHWVKIAHARAKLAKSIFEEIKMEQSTAKQEHLVKDAEDLTRRMVESLTKGLKTHPSNNEDDRNNGNHPAEEEEGAGPPAALSNNGNGSGASVITIPPLHLLNTLSGQRPLRPYQLTALQWLIHLYSNGLNGILADEMGLGKTVQTIALLCYYAEYKQDWGPHLIVVPTTVVLNWELECRRWAPGLKVITYIGSAKERLQLRKGWTADGAFNICITSFHILMQDRNVFRRRPWGFLVVDEAHAIKNWKGKMWQGMFDLQAMHRLLLTGTPLQNSVMELWSLLRFLLPNSQTFDDDEEFQEWFSKPMEDMVAGRAVISEKLIQRLHAMIRPFMLRRLKVDVETQLPPKTEKIIKCQLSRRQRQLYDEIRQSDRSRIRTEAAFSFSGMFGTLMALRKTCNHPDLVAERPIRSPLVLCRFDPFVIRKFVPKIVFSLGILEDCNSPSWLRRQETVFDLIPSLEAKVRIATGHPSPERRRMLDYAQFESDRAELTSGTGRLQTELSKSALKESLRFPSLKASLSFRGTVEEELAPAAIQLKSIRVSQCVKRREASRQRPHSSDTTPTRLSEATWNKIPAEFRSVFERIRPSGKQSAAKERKSGRSDNNALSEVPSSQSWVERSQRLRCFEQDVQSQFVAAALSVLQRDFGAMRTPSDLDRSRGLQFTPFAAEMLIPTVDQRSIILESLLARVGLFVPKVQVATPPMLVCRKAVRLGTGFHRVSDKSGAMTAFVSRCRPLIPRGLSRTPTIPAVLGLFVDSALLRKASLQSVYTASYLCQENWTAVSRRSYIFPDRWLLIHDCGKLQVLKNLLPKLKAENHRMLIFTQFTKMLDLLERFLALLGFRYLRIDGQTKPEIRQRFVERFNVDESVTVMILSTRSGGIGVNLVGADTVIFYDSDWNPAIDLQAQDRCHRIGQTRAVTIYRLVSEGTVEETIVKISKDRTMLNNVVIRGGGFTGGEVLGKELEATRKQFRLIDYFHDLSEDADLETIRAQQEADRENDAALARPRVTLSAEDERLAEMARREAEDVEDREAEDGLNREVQQDEQEQQDLDTDGAPAPGEGNRTMGGSFTAVGGARGGCTSTLALKATAKNRSVVEGLSASTRRLIDRLHRDLERRFDSDIDRRLLSSYPILHFKRMKSQYQSLQEGLALETPPPIQSILL